MSCELGVFDSDEEPIKRAVLESLDPTHDDPVVDGLDLDPAAPPTPCDHAVTAGVIDQLGVVVPLTLSRCRLHVALFTVHLRTNKAAAS